MRWTIETDLAAYAARVLPWLERDPVESNVLCTSMGARLDGSGPADPQLLLAWLDRGDGSVAGAALRTPPSYLLLPALPAGAAAALADRLHAHGAEVPGVRGPVRAADTFADTWAARTGARPEVRFNERLYRLGVLTAPDRVPGTLRRATEADLALLVEWTVAFEDEAGLTRGPDVEAATARRAASGRLHLWTVDGTPTCVVGSHCAAGGVVRIGPVYTPPAHRRRGYGAAATAALSGQLLDAGARACILYTDLANPTSNAVYQRIGYRPVSDHRTWRFGGP